MRTITRVHLWGRNPARAAAVAEAVAEADGPPVRVCASAREAVAEADIVCTLTSAQASQAAVLEGGWLKPGAHVNAVGACTPMHRELDTEAVRRSRVFVDTMAACLKEPGDLVAPLSCGEIEPSHLLGELGAVLGGTLEGRTSDDEITLFKSVGIALEDLTAAVAMQAGC